MLFFRYIEQHLPISSKTLTGRLSLFFLFVSIIIGLCFFSVIYSALLWSEDLVGERRIMIDRDEAIMRFNNGEQGVITIDVLTKAYNNEALLPLGLRSYLHNKTSFLGEVDVDSNSYMLYFGHYNKVSGSASETSPLILVTQFDDLEFKFHEVILSATIALGLVLILMLFFGLLLHRLSKHLIDPINALSAQLTNYQNDTEQTFYIAKGAVVEFDLFTQQLNHYRDQANKLIKREQAFSRYVSHELRTPLTIISGANHLLQQKFQQQNMWLSTEQLSNEPQLEKESHYQTKQQQLNYQQRQTTRIAQASQQMLIVVNALLALVRYERDPDSNTARYLTKVELDSIIQLYQYQADEKQLHIICQVVAEPTIFASKAIVNMIVSNLLRNAIAATSQGEIEVILTDHDLTILDQGCGLIHSDASSSSAPTGHGLGLMIVDDLCQRYQWHFSLTNRIASTTSSQPIGCQATINFKS